jgi:long-subunit fatty acid transport protein
MTFILSRAARVAVILVSVSLSLVLGSGSALAAGIDVPDLGAASLGKGAADAAAPDTLMAIYYNPAGLATQSGFRFLVDARGLQEITTFQRIDPGSSIHFPAVTDAGNKGFGGYLLAPAFGISYGFKLLIPWTVALGGMPPTGYSNDEYPDFFAIRSKLPSGASYTNQAALASPQRYNLISQTTTGYVLSLSLAAEILPFLDAGAQLQVPIYAFNITQATYLYPQQEAGVAAYDALVALKATNGFNPTGSFGLSVHLPLGFSIGAAAQGPSTIVGHGTMDITLPPSSPLVSQTKIGPGDGLTFTIHLPWVVRGGIRLDQPAFELELDGVYEAWSMYKDIGIQPHNIPIQITEKVASGQTRVLENSTVPAQAVPTGMTDAYSIRLGGELRLGAFAQGASFMKIRAGVMYESSAVPIAYTSLNEINWDRVIPTVGLGFAIWKFDLDVAYAHAFQPERIVQDSQVLQSTGGATPIVVGNGDYKVNINMLALAFSGHFG